ncbi:MAG TPA: ParA family protein [Rhodopila sp.]|uniref:ParA family protein n=1 Tax=Rhodopila sp. TaxID=2480087 RepID=UPI002C9B1199|nr:ParA family protein [Rhodopila sp.]HVY15702.1 ParA family protein [Rhodopila sp.]
MPVPALGGFITRESPVPSLHGRALGVINRARLDGTSVVLVASGKGGCGKTTLLLNTAVGYARARRRVLIIDADIEQRTSQKWPRPANLNNPTVVECAPRDILETLAANIAGSDMVLIDLPGRDVLATGPVMEVVDLLVSPSKPTHQDMQELGRFIRIAQARQVPHLVVFNEANREATAEIEGLKQAFAEFAPFLPIAMQQLSSYRRVYPNGRGVLEIQTSDPARENFARVFDGLRGEIARAHSQRMALL